MGVFERDAYNYDPDAPLDDENIPARDGDEHHRYRSDSHADHPG